MAQLPFIQIPNAADDNTPSLALYGYSIPDKVGRPYLYYGSGSQLNRINTDTNQVEARYNPSLYAAFVGAYVQGSDGKLYHSARIQYGQGYMWQVDPMTGVWQRLGAPGGAFNTIAASFGAIQQTIAYNNGGVLRVAAQDGGLVGIYDPSRPNLDSPNYDTGSALIRLCNAPTSGWGMFVDKSGTLWTLSATAANRIDVNNITSWGQDFFGNRMPYCGTTAFPHTISLPSIVGVVYDSETHRLWVLDKVRAGWVLVDVATWTEIGFLSGSWWANFDDYTAMLQGFVGNKIMAVAGDAASDSNARYFSKLTLGAQISVFDIFNWLTPPGRVSSILYHSDSNSVFMHSGTSIYRLYLDDGDNQPMVFIST